MLMLGRREDRSANAAAAPPAPRGRRDWGPPFRWDDRTGGASDGRRKGRAEVSNHRTGHGRLARQAIWNEPCRASVMGLWRGGVSRLRYGKRRRLDRGRDTPRSPDASLV